MKERQRRGEPAPPEATVIVRAYRLEPAMLARDAQRNFDAYGFFGLSVFAETDELRWELIAADKFPRAEWITLFSAVDIYDAGLELWDTGRAPHFDIVHAELDELLRRILGAPHRMLPNPEQSRGQG
jgi:hypothetical protein